MKKKDIKKLIKKELRKELDSRGYFRTRPSRPSYTSSPSRPSYTSALASLISALGSVAQAESSSGSSYGSWGAEATAGSQTRGSIHQAPRQPSSSSYRADEMAQPRQLTLEQAIANFLAALRAINA